MMLRTLGSLIPQGSEGTRSGSPPPDPFAEAEPRRGVSWFQKLAAIASQFAFFNFAGRIFSRKQLKFLRNVVDMFEKGNFDEALRSAIPLGGLEKALDQPLRRPYPRRAL